MRAMSSYLHFGINALGDLVFELIGSGVRLGQQEWIIQGAILWLHDLLKRHLENLGRRE